MTELEPRVFMERPGNGISEVYESICKNCPVAKQALLKENKKDVIMYSISIECHPLFFGTVVRMQTHAVGKNYNKHPNISVTRACKDYRKSIEPMPALETRK